MNIYLVSQCENTNYYTYDSFVVACNTAEEAINTNPYGGKIDWEKQALETCSSWAKRRKSVSAKLIGVASEDQVAGIICVSFSAGQTIMTDRSKESLDHEVDKIRYAGINMKTTRQKKNSHPP